MSFTISVNGTDLATQNIYVGGTFDAWQSAPASTRAVLNMPSRVRGILSRSDAVAARTFPLPIYLATTTLSARVAAMDYLKALHRQQVTVQMADGTTTRELIGTITAIQLEPNTTLNNPAAKGTLTILAADPVWRATSDTTASSLSSTPTTIALGTAPVEDWALDLTVTGGSDPRTLTVTIGGTTSQTMTWTGTLGSNTLHANASTSGVLKNTTNAISGWVGGFPALDPANGTCTLAVSSSSGTAAGTLTYRKRYY